MVRLTGLTHSRAVVDATLTLMDTDSVVIDDDVQMAFIQAVRTLLEHGAREDGVRALVAGYRLLPYLLFDHTPLLERHNGDRLYQVLRSYAGEHDPEAVILSARLGNPMPNARLS